MIFNVTVDLSDFYTDNEDQSFTEAIKKEIARQVKEMIFADWKHKINEIFQQEVMKTIEQEKQAFITSVLNELVVTAKVKKRYNSTEMISISEWLVEELERTQLSSSNLKEYLDRQTKQASDKIGTELKTRYDMLFASQIVAKLHENSMLKEDIAKLLLDPKKPE